MGREQLTDRQTAILMEIASLIKSRGFPPTLQEVADACGISQNAATLNINAIERKGWLSREHRISRSIIILALPGEDVEEVSP